MEIANEQISQSQQAEKPGDVGHGRRENGRALCGIESQLFHDEGNARPAAARQRVIDQERQSHHQSQLRFSRVFVVQATVDTLRHLDLSADFQAVMVAVAFFWGHLVIKNVNMWSDLISFVDFDNVWDLVSMT